MRGKMLGVRAKILAGYGSLLPAEKKVADYLLKNIGTVEKITTHDLAEKTNTSKAAVTRFCQHLGFKGFKDFKVAAIKDNVLGIKNLHETVEEEDSVSTLIEKVCNVNEAACKDTSLLLDSGDLETIARLILNSGKIFLFGDGASSPIIIDFYQKMLRAGIVCVYASDRRFQIIQGELMSEKDVAIAFDLSGESIHPLHMLEVANKKKCTTVAINTSIGSPLSQAATYNLYGTGKVTSSVTGTFAPRISLLCIVDCLFTTLIKISGDRFTQEFKATLAGIATDWV